MENVYKNTWIVFFANLNQPKNLEALSRAFYVVALLLGSWYYLLCPVESSARDAYDALCGHDAWHIFFDCHITTKGKSGHVYSI